LHNLNEDEKTFKPIMEDPTFVPGIITQSPNKDFQIEMVSSEAPTSDLGKHIKNLAPLSVISPSNQNIDFGSWVNNYVGLNGEREKVDFLKDLSKIRDSLNDILISVFETLAKKDRRWIF
jgi:hypothetical protein